MSPPPGEQPRTPTHTTLTAAPAPVTVGESVGLCATVTGGGGPVDSGLVRILDGALLLGAVPVHAGSASVAVRLLSGGRHALAASYDGDARYEPSAGACAVVVLEPTTVHLAAALDRATVTLTARVHDRWRERACTGWVLFECDGEPLGSAELVAGEACLACALTPGAHTLGAAYGGDQHYGGARSRPLTISDESRYGSAGRSGLAPSGGSG